MATRTGGRPVVGAQAAAAGPAAGLARRSRFVAARAARPAATAASSNASARSMPAAWASRTSVGGGQPGDGRRRRRGPRPGTSIATVRPRIEDQAAVHPPEHARVVLRAQDRCSRPGPAPRGGRRPPSCRPGRAGRSARRGRGRTCPSRRCWRSPRAAARRPTGRTARDRRGGRCDSRASVASIRASMSARGHAQVLEPERELLADGQLRCRELVGRRREDDPDPPEQRRRPCGAASIPSMATRPRAWPGPRAG